MQGRQAARVAAVGIPLLVLTVAWCTSGATSLLAAAAEPSSPAPSASTTGTLPRLHEHRYRMAAKIRPLLFFWIGKDNVGGGRITWRGDGQTTGYELLIGSDPELAPRRINRWGYVAEQVSGRDATLLGVMKESNEASIDEAKARLNLEDRGDADFAFKAIRSTVKDDRAQAEVSTVIVDHDLTFRDLDALLDALETPDAAVASKQKSRTLPETVRPGFLASVAELVHRSVTMVRETGGVRGLKDEAVGYLYNGTLYDLRVRKVSLRDELKLGEARYRDVLDTAFEIRNRQTGDKTRFRLAYGTEGALAEIPVRIVYQPRWWFAAELVLDEEVDFQ